MTGSRPAGPAGDRGTPGRADARSEDTDSEYDAKPADTDGGYGARLQEGDMEPDIAPGGPSDARSQDGAPGADVVLLTVPADGAYLGVLRTAAAGLAARLHFALDEIEDLRIAVDEACAMLIRIAAPAAPLRCTFALAGDELGVEVAVPAAPGATPPATSSFAWKVLTALASATTASIADQHATIALTARHSR